MIEPKPLAMPRQGLLFAQIDERLVMNPDFEPLLDVQTAATKLCLHPKTVMRMARENRIPAFHVGRYWLFRASLIDAWLNGKLQWTPANLSA